MQSHDLCYVETRPPLAQRAGASASCTAVTHVSGILPYNSVYFVDIPHTWTMFQLCVIPQILDREPEL